ncbi:hypothetical protein ABIG04_009386 [Bradyrhizobium japonicum]
MMMLQKPGKAFRFVQSGEMLIACSAPTISTVRS